MATANSKKTTKKTPGRPFQPGQSGNPSGRPKIPEEFKELARRHSVPALLKVIEIMEDARAEHKDKLKAAEIIMDRAWGKATQDMEVNATMSFEIKGPNWDG